MKLRCGSCGFDVEFARITPRFCSNCGASFSRAPEPTEVYRATRSSRYEEDTDAVTTLSLPETVGGYRLLRSLGAGGMGTVYEGEQDTTGRRVAIKLIRPEYADSPDTVERFRREGRLASTITHPRCVFVLAADEEAGRPYIVMELMPGRTLADLVAEDGPLPVSGAVTRILDVIEGLQEAHRCGLIHRDVKPSNCFLEADGRVKVGDFGLSKSLLHDGQLTQTGSFLGTLLYAAPEQIRNEPVDMRADIYAVAATLYFLLSGRAPFQMDDDPAATLARTMTDPLTPLRALRSDIPTTLEEVVCKGLARARDKRWESLEEFRLALLPFVPGNHAVPAIGVRLGAWYLDWMLMYPVKLLFLAIVYQGPQWLAHFTAHWFPSAQGVIAASTETAAFFRDLSQHDRILVSLAASILVGLAFFAIPECIWGCSPGKYLCRLRVRTNRTGDRPGFARAALRFLVFYLLLDFGRVLTTLQITWRLEQTPDLPGQGTDATLMVPLFAVMFFLITLVSESLGLLLVGLPMRRRNGFRGLHEFLSGTRTIRLSGGPVRRLLHGFEAVTPAGPQPRDLPVRVGAYQVCGALRWSDGDRLLLGEDSALGRSVWVWLRQPSTSPLSPARREVGRTTRPRWLAGGSLAGLTWDAFVASPGCSLPNLVGPHRLYGADVLPVLEQLTEELEAATIDGTLPATLGVDQVWVQTSGRVQLLDTPSVPPPYQIQEGDKRALDFLAYVARFMLMRDMGEGGGDSPVRAPLPRFAAQLIGRLTGAGQPFDSLGAFRAALEESRERPVEVSRTRRGFHLILLAALLLPGMVFMFGSIPFVLAGFYFENQRMAKTCEELSRQPYSNADNADLQNKKEIAERNQAAATRSLGRFLYLLPEHSRDLTRQQVDRKYPGKPPPAHLSPEARATALREAAGRKPHSVIATKNYGGMCLLIAAWPALWILWAGMTRGGLGFRFAGIQLVQANGRRAARWRCAVRALLVWLPVLCLLGISGSLEIWRLHYATEVELPAWLAGGVWLLAVVLLPLFLWLVQRTPNRGPHDRLAGTFLVPR